MCTEAVAGYERADQRTGQFKAITYITRTVCLAAPIVPIAQSAFVRAGPSQSREGRKKHSRGYKKAEADLKCGMCV